MASVTPVQDQILSERFPGMLTADPRPGYSGWLLERDHLLEVCQALRDDLGYDFLSSVTGVDYLPEGKMEVVYHFYKITGGPGVVLKVQVSRQDPIEIPSIVHIYAGAEFQEREIWDLFGIRFTGHPDLRRILMWEGFAGHPLRKDWTEPFFEEEGKPFKSRWPEGIHQLAESKNKFGDNIAYPPDFNPEDQTFDAEQALYDSLRTYQKNEIGLETDHIIVNLGPQHPSTHGVFRVAVMLDGENIVNLKPVMGYLHRNHEKIGERNTFILPP
jgi:NADH-quinone oxidoreductase subunit C/D